jgi:hypothetical protein
VSVFATATGIGSWPGTSPRRAAEVIVGELHQLPYLTELPARGVGADMIGRDRRNRRRAVACRPAVPAARGAAASLFAVAAR